MGNKKERGQLYRVSTVESELEVPGGGLGGLGLWEIGDGN